MILAYTDVNAQTHILITSETVDIASQDPPPYEPLVVLALRQELALRYTRDDLFEAEQDFRFSNQVICQVVDGVVAFYAIQGHGAHKPGIPVGSEEWEKFLDQLVSEKQKEEEQSRLNATIRSRITLYSNGKAAQVFYARERADHLGTMIR